MSGLKQSPLVGRALDWQDAGGMGVLTSVSALVSGVTALALAAVVMLGAVYGNWKLAQVQRVFVYVSADADAAVLESMMTALRAVPNVQDVAVLPAAEVRADLAVYGPLVAELPLPQVVAIGLQGDADAAVKAQLEGLVRSKFAHAEVDDASAALASVAAGVRLSLQAGVGLAVAMALLLGGVMVLTVRAGLRAKQPTLKLLMQLGARDATLVGLAVRGVLLRLMGGWLLGSGVAALVVVASAAAWPAMGAVVTPLVWGVVAVAPLVLLGVGVLAAAWVAGQEVRKLG